MNLDQSKVDAIILRYETQGPHELIPLMDMQRELAAQSYWYSQLLGQVAKDYRTARVNRKTENALIIAKSKASSVAARVAEAEANHHYRELYRAEYELEGRLVAGKLQIGAIKYRT
jgi:1-acyl-sn-glycerol-3-phosphate acyltransferase